MTELTPPNTRQHLAQTVLNSRSGLTLASIIEGLRGQVPSPRELQSVAPIRRALLLGLVVLTAFTAIAPIVLIVSLEIAIAGQSAPGSRGGGSLAGREGQGVGNYEHILQRPLFSRSRQAVAPAVPQQIVDKPAPPARAMLDPSVALRGVFMSGERAKAFLTSSDDPVGVWIALNEQWSGWRLSEVKPNEIVLEAEGERQTLPLNVLAK
ncbi:hypothetical protein JQ580_26645 [Bradyrhizobium japonicum]|uniref:hypothetical protein n=1 Tax=Bradyrhizobium japonicum TaxID=375 RepID=UPI001BAA793C|nr:hypothetical protein [Bradyrhizobium japonicum]MBR0994306.1 hypothetical protein [Bradyrhizobium japonicum]